MWVLVLMCVRRRRVVMATATSIVKRRLLLLLLVAAKGLATNIPSTDTVIVSHSFGINVVHIKTTIYSYYGRLSCRGKINRKENNWDILERAPKKITKDTSLPKYGNKMYVIDIQTIKRMKTCSWYVIWTSYTALSRHCRWCFSNFSFFETGVYSQIKSNEKQKLI
jgi:hypothetical protein